MGRRVKKESLDCQDLKANKDHKDSREPKVKQDNQGMLDRKVDQG